MKKVSEFRGKADFVLTDIDDTLTDEGQLGPESYSALWDLHRAGVQVIPVTGRPAGWCEMIARMWPVAGIVGENGGFYFRYADKKMHREFFYDEATISANRAKLDRLQDRIPREVPGSALASDQFCRLMDLAVDFCEDVAALPRAEVDRIVKIFESEGAVAKISSIHVNGWFGDYDKLTMSLRFLKDVYGLDTAAAKARAAFCGDSPNDEPMFGAFPMSFGVANINQFSDRLKSPPTFVASKNGGHGFAEIARQILAQRSHA